MSPLLVRYRIRSLGSSSLMFAHVAYGYLSGAIDYRVKVWDIAAASAICKGSGLEFRFIDVSPFLKGFSPQRRLLPMLLRYDRFLP